MCLLEQLERYEPYNEQEARDRALLLRALREEEMCSRARMTGCT